MDVNTQGRHYLAITWTHLTAGWHQFILDEEENDTIKTETAESLSTVCRACLSSYFIMSRTYEHMYMWKKDRRKREHDDDRKTHWFTFEKKRKQKDWHRKRVHTKIHMLRIDFIKRAGWTCCCLQRTPHISLKHQGKSAEAGRPVVATREQTWCEKPRWSKRTQAT